MKKNIIRTLVMVPLLASASIFAAHADDNTKTVIGTVNGTDIYRSDADDVLAKLANANHLKAVPDYSTLKDDQKLAVIKEVAAKKLVDNEVLNAKLAQEQDIHDKLAAIEKELLRNEFLARKGKEAVTPEKVRARYDEFVKATQGKDEVRLRHILVNDEETANKIYKKLEKSPSSFVEVAKVDSVDKNSAASGGDLGYLLETALTKDFADAIQNLKKGQISKPVKNQYGWHIIKLEDRRKAVIPPFETVKPAIEQQLAAQGSQDYVKSLLDSAKIEPVKN